MICYFSVWRWIFALIVFFTSISATAGSTFKLDLSSGPLLGCLEQISQVAQVRIVDTSGRAASATCVAIRGEFSLEQVLDRLLKPLALDWRRRGDGTIEIVAAKRLALELAGLTIEGAPVNEPERPTGPAPTVLAEHATALTRIDKQWLDTAPLLGFNQIGRYAPNVYGTGRSLSIRGIERADDQFTSLTVSLDGIDLGTRLLDDELIPLDDVDHLDLARGPRSFEAGGGAEAGAIRLVTVAPSLEPTLRGTVGVGNEGAWRSGLKGSGPIGSTGLGATLALERRVLPNFIDQRVVPEANQQRRNDSARLKLSFAPEAMPELKAQLAALSVSGDSSDRWIHPYDGPPPLDGSVSDPPTFDPFKRDSYATEPTIARTQAHGMAGFVRYEHSNGWAFDLHAAKTGIERDGVHQKPSNGLQTQPNLKFDSVETYEIESRQRFGIRVQNQSSPDWTWIASLEHEALDSLPYSMTIEPGSPNARVALSQYSTQTPSAALWLDHSWSETWKTGMGLRWSREVATTSARGGICSIHAPRPCTNFTYVRISAAAHQLPIPLAVVEWHPWPEQTFSLSHGNGYRSGGSQSPGIGYDPEHEQNTELSWRAQWRDHRLHTMLTVFAGVIRDRYSFLNSNGGRIRSRGVEFELDSNLSERWRLRAGIGLLDSRYLTFIYSSADLAGQPTSGAPRQTALLGLHYGTEHGWYGALDAYHAAVAETGTDNLAILQRPPYSLVDLRVGYRTSHWETTLLMTNALNEQYIDRVETYLNGMGRYRLGDPGRIEWHTSWNW